MLCFYYRCDNPSPTRKTVLIACSTASFPQESLESALRRVAWAGFEAVELDLSAMEPPDASDLRERLHAEGLEAAAINAGVAPEVVGEAAFADWARLGRIASLARDLDCPCIVIAAPQSGEQTALRDGLVLLDKALGDLPVEICLVNRSGSLLSTIEDIAALTDLGVPARVRLALDPAQAEGAGWDPLSFSALPTPPVHVYWNDLSSGMVVPPGEGELPLFALAEALMGAPFPPRSVTVSLENADPWQVEPLAREVYRQTVVQFETVNAP